MLIKATSFKFEGLFLFVDFVSPKEREKKKINKRRTTNRTEWIAEAHMIQYRNGLHCTARILKTEGVWLIDL